MDCSISANLEMKVSEGEKQNKFLDLFKELKKLWNINMTRIPIVMGGFGTVFMKPSANADVKISPKKEKW